MKTTITKFSKKITEGLTVKHVLFIMAGAAIYSFGIHNIHQRVDITEGGVIGLMLLAEHWLGFSPALITPVLDVACYLLAFRYLGKKFIRTSILSTACVSLCYGHLGAFSPSCCGSERSSSGSRPPGRSLRGRRRRHHCPAGRLQRWRRCSGPCHLPHLPLPSVQSLPVHRHYRASAVLKLHSAAAHRLPR